MKNSPLSTIIQVLTITLMSVLFLHVLAVRPASLGLFQKISKPQIICWLFIYFFIHTKNCQQIQYIVTRISLNKQLYTVTCQH